MIELPPPLVLSAPAILRPCEIERQNPRLFELYLELRGYDPDWLRLAIASMPGFRTPHVAYDADGSVSKTATGAWSYTVPNFETSLVGTFIGAGAGGGTIANDGSVSNGGNGGATTCTGGISAGGGSGGQNAISIGAQGVSGSGGIASGGTNTNGQAGGVVAAGTNKGGDAPGGGAGGAAPVSTDPQAGNAGSAAGGGGSGARFNFISKYGGGGGSGGRVVKTWLRGELTPGASLSGDVGVGGAGGGVAESATYPGGAGARGQADLVWT